MKIGLVQTAPVFGEKRANREQIDGLIGASQAELWVLPELALTGYEFVDRKEAQELAEEIPAGESCRWLAEICAGQNCHAVMGLAERDGERVYNSAVLMGPQGLVATYRKLHLFERETERFDPGNLPLAVHDIGIARVGLMICFDWRFPEAARTLALRGAQIIAHPSNLVMPYCQAAMVTRALENRVFCATTNRIGTETRAGRELSFTGRSQIIAPDGKRLCEAGASEAAVVFAEMDPKQADNKHATKLNDLFQDRRPEFYA
jgi:predicted amidohydrolase